jgi:hypothetical protein
MARPGASGATVDITRTSKMSVSPDPGNRALYVVSQMKQDVRPQGAGHHVDEDARSRSSYWAITPARAFEISRWRTSIKTTQSTYSD